YRKLRVRGRGERRSQRSHRRFSAPGYVRRFFFSAGNSDGPRQEMTPKARWSVPRLDHREGLMAASSRERRASLREDESQPRGCEGEVLRIVGQRLDVDAKR